MTEGCEIICLIQYLNYLEIRVSSYYNVLGRISTHMKASSEDNCYCVKLYGFSKIDIKPIFSTGTRAI